MSKLRGRSEELSLTHSALRRREFQERLLAERALGAQAAQKATERDQRRLLAAGEQQALEARALQTREATRQAGRMELAVSAREERRPDDETRTRKDKEQERGHTSTVEPAEKTRERRARGSQAKEKSHEGAERLQERRRLAGEIEKALHQREEQAGIAERMRRKEEARRESLAERQNETELEREWAAERLSQRIRREEVAAREAAQDEEQVPKEAVTRKRGSVREGRGSDERDRLTPIGASREKPKQEPRAEPTTPESSVKKDDGGRVLWRVPTGDDATPRKTRQGREREVQDKVKKRQVRDGTDVEARPSFHARKSRTRRVEAAPAAKEKLVRSRVQRVRPFLSTNVTASSARAAVVGVANAAAVPADATPYLRVSGSFLVNENGDAVSLRGVCVRGLDQVSLDGGQNIPTALALDTANLTAMTRQWGANLIRLPFARQTILAGNGTLNATDLLAGLDLAVAAITEAGAHVLLSLEAAPGEAPSDAETLQMWQTLILRYQGEPRVFFELFRASGAMAAGWSQEIGALALSLREQVAGTLLFVPAGVGGVDVSSIPLLSGPSNPIANLVYTVSVENEEVTTPEILTGASSAYPLFVSAWADDGGDLGRTSAHLGELFGGCGMGWAAANWNAEPRIVTDAAGHDFSATLWGNVVRGAMSVVAPPLREASDAPPPLSAQLAQGRGLPRLSTSGNALLDDEGNSVVLRGVTVTGLDTVSPEAGETIPAALGIDTENLALMTDTWGINLVRIPFQARTVLVGNGPVAAGKILAGLDLAIASLCDAGLYVLLAMEGDAAPDTTTLQAWQMTAHRYQDQPGVHYELFSSAGTLGVKWSQVGFVLLGAVRQEDPNALIFMGSGNGGTDVTGLPLQLATGDPMPNVVYTISVSPQTLPGPDEGPLGVFADAYPVFASMWTDDANNPSRLSPSAGDFFARHNIGFAAAAWNGDPRLVMDAVNQGFAATAWGSIAMRAARLPIRPVLKGITSDRIS